MLSKKMAFSLMSLITILALAFVVPSAMAATFGADLIMTEDVSHQDGLQLESASGNLAIEVKYAKAIKLEAKHVFVTIYDSDGDLKSIPAIAAATAADTVVFAPIIAAQEITFTVPSTLLMTGGTRDVSKIVIKIAKDIAAADVTSTDKTEAKTFDVHVVGADTVGTSPDVLKIALVGEPFATVTTSEFQVHVLLSEDVKKDGLKAAGLDVGEATVKSVVKLASPLKGTLVQDAGLVGRPGQSPADPVLTGTTVFSALTTWRDGKLHLYLVTLTAKPPAKKMLPSRLTLSLGMRYRWLQKPKRCIRGLRMLISLLVGIY